MFECVILIHSHLHQHTEAGLELSPRKGFASPCIWCNGQLASSGNCRALPCNLGWGSLGGLVLLPSLQHDLEHAAPRASGACILMLPGALSPHEASYQRAFTPAMPRRC